MVVPTATASRLSSQRDESKIALGEARGKQRNPNSRPVGGAAADLAEVSPSALIRHLSSFEMGKYACLTGVAQS